MKIYATYTYVGHVGCSKKIHIHNYGNKIFLREEELYMKIVRYVKW